MQECRGQTCSQCWVSVSIMIFITIEYIELLVIQYYFKLHP